MSRTGKGDYSYVYLLKRRRIEFLMQFLKLCNSFIIERRVKSMNAVAYGLTRGSFLRCRNNRRRRFAATARMETRDEDVRRRGRKCWRRHLTVAPVTNVAAI